MSVKDKGHGRGKADTTLRDRAGEAIDSARESAIEAYDSAREGAVAAGRSVGDGIGSAPLMTLAGGLAVGALVAALLPRTKVEDKLIGPVGERVTGAGRAAVDAARSAGQDKLADLNITREAGKGVVDSIVDGLGQAVRASGQAALGSVRGER
ncbi:MAG: hypothetical protein ABIT69_09235 [Sphingomicrobium sp.]